MIFRTEPPPAPLRPFIEYLWYHEGMTTEHRMERLLPDGAIELIIDLTDPPKRLFDSRDVRRFTTLRRSWISGQHSHHIIIEAAMDSCMIGARFRPGGAFPLLGIPIRDLNDLVIEMDALWGSAIGRLRDRLLETPGVNARLQILAAELLARSINRLERDPIVERALEVLIDRRAEITIRALTRGMGISQKRLVRAFEERVGLKPKMLARIVRFQAVVRQLEHQSGLSWSSIATDFGYFDQSHFIRDFQALSGMSPSEYLAEKGEYLNFVPFK